MSRGTRQAREFARARVNEIRRELREIYRRFPELRFGRPVFIQRNPAKAHHDFWSDSQPQPSLRRWLARGR